MLTRPHCHHPTLLAVLACLGSACGDDKDEAPASAGDLLVVANVEKSAFIGTTSLGGAHHLSASHEVGTYPAVSDPRPARPADRPGRRGAQLHPGARRISGQGSDAAAARGFKSIGTLFASDDKAYVSLSGAGKVLVIDRAR